MLLSTEQEGVEGGDVPHGDPDLVNWSAWETPYAAWSLTEIIRTLHGAACNQPDSRCSLNLLHAWLCFVTAFYLLTWSSSLGLKTVK